MSQAAFDAAEEAAHEEEDTDLDDAVDGDEDQDDGEEEAEVEAKPAVDWEKKFHDAKGQAAKERSRARAEGQQRRALEDRVAAMEKLSKTGDDDEIEALAKKLRDDDDDPIEDLATAKAIIRQFVNAQKADRETTTQQQNERRQVQALITTMEEHEADFHDDHPDYYDAAKHYRAERQSELEEQGYSGSELQSALARDLFGVTQRAISAGKDPAETVYNLAKKRGFKADEASTDDKLKKLSESSRTGSRPSGGRGGTSPLTMGAVAAMKGADRDKAFAKLREEQKRAER